ncbi:putative 1-phosphatidylinositol-4-phosphate 5-kinase [Helianthus annuus]|uniref:Putative MORN motif protein n=2 Tax=Helianthus annuus TaxID=4232 RepID=A0A251UFA8_HELAN|nr:putative 1-phosphatidylinositol-4-phosphate 5-kinase [Helianthus annuus]KAJ0736717.1 putative 1-phosphatidylinositol-4-phosphate 5-kinase [Helianthus annuus]KAJ0910364.1 putative 1-phosphatidylinositol-4-phosphate 5-kinase [Helianthus annuus]
MPHSPLPYLYLQKLSHLIPFMFPSSFFQKPDDKKKPKILTISESQKNPSSNPFNYLENSHPKNQEFIKFRLLLIKFINFVFQSMRQKKPGFQIGEIRSFSDSKSPKFQLQENPNLEIQIPVAKYNEQRVHFSSNPPKKLVVMSHHRRNSHKKSLICCSSSEALLATKTIALKLLKFAHVKLFWIKAPFRVLILLFLPSVYYFSLSYKSSYLCVLVVIVFCSVFVSLFDVSSFNSTNLPSVRLFVARKFPSLKLYGSDNVSKPHPLVVWSIGSKTRLDESVNSGFLVKVYSNGDVYEGEFYKGKCSGSGVYYYNLNGRYEGDWVDQKYDGYGVETWAKGSRYRGQYRQGLRCGYGVYKFYTGDMYAGEWFKGQCHGYGVHTCEDGSKYTGEFKGGIKHGLGHYHFRNGDKYAGEYFADKMHGFGVYRFANGHRYEGAWHEGRRQGFGMYTFRNGETQSGHWDNGALTVSTSQDSSLSGSSSSVSHVKVLKAVQEARRIAGKAVSVADVDERVNRAVIAANRAANAARVAAVKAVQNRIRHHSDDDDLPLDVV